MDHDDKSAQPSVKRCECFKFSLIFSHDCCRNNEQIAKETWAAFSVFYPNIDRRLKNYMTSRLSAILSIVAKINLVDDILTRCGPKNGRIFSFHTVVDRFGARFKITKSLPRSLKSRYLFLFCCHMPKRNQVISICLVTGKNWIHCAMLQKCEIR